MSLDVGCIHIRVTQFHRCVQGGDTFLGEDIPATWRDMLFTYLFASLTINTYEMRTGLHD